MAFIKTLCTLPALTDIEVLKAMPAWIGALCAVIGLRTWQHQLHYREDYDLARKLLLSAYKYRNSLHQARFPMRRRYLPPGSSKEEIQAIQISEWSTDRNQIYSALSELQAALLEAEVVLGRNLESYLRNLRECEQELIKNKEDELRSILEDRKHHLNSSQERDERAKILYAKVRGNDEFRTRIDNSLRNFEGEIRPMLGEKYWHQRRIQALVSASLNRRM